LYAALISAIIGLLIVILAIGIPYWLTHRHMRPQNDPHELQAYEEATGRPGPAIPARKPTRPFWHGGNASRRWSAAQSSDRMEVAEPAEAALPAETPPTEALPAETPSVEPSEPHGSAQSEFAEPRPRGR
jgi:hypothetical protein